MIPVTDEDYDRFLLDEGLLGKRLVLALKTASGDQRVLNYSCGTCRFHTRKGLCSVQLKKGHDFIPQVCRDYPRFYRNYRAFEERLIDLSCEEGARLLIDTDALSFTVYEGEADSLPCCTNDDLGFLEALCRTRGSVIDALWSVSSYEELSNELNRLLTYLRICEQRFVAGETDFLSTNPYDTFQYNGPVTKELFPFDAETYDQLLSREFKGLPLWRTNPTLSRLCKLYFRSYQKKLTHPQAWEQIYVRFAENFPEEYSFFVTYYSYYLYGYFLRSFEDYSFYKNAALGVLHLNMILLFSVLSADNGGELTKEQKASILSSYTKKAFYNEELQGGMYELFTSRFSDPLSL